MSSNSNGGTRSRPGPTSSGLPRSIFVQDEDPRRDAREAVDAVLSDGFMAAISILLVPIIVLPFFVTLPAAVANAFQVGDIVIILVFVVEYGSKLYLALDRRAFVRSPWHLLDLAVIVLSFVSYLPILGLHGTGSVILLLRLLRLPRVFAVAGRATSLGVAPAADTTGPPPAPPEPILRQLDPGHLLEAREISWAELEQHLATTEVEWIDLSRLSESALVRLSAAIRVPIHHFRYDQLDDIWPHFSRLESAVLLFLQSGEIRYPTTSREFYTIARRGAILVLRGPKVLTVTPEGVDAIDRVRATLDVATTNAENFRARVVEGVLEAMLQNYRGLLADVELEIAQIGRAPRSRLPKDFLARVYELQKAISRLAANIGHFRELLGRFASGRVTVEGEEAGAKERFESLADEVSYLSDLASDASESVGTIIDIYVNQSSFETNRVLKILAVITAVTLIPATLGSVLGIDGPYDFVLWQITLIIVFGMVFVTYVFLKLGWLRS